MKFLIPAAALLSILFGGSLLVKNAEAAHGGCSSCRNGYAKCYWVENGRRTEYYKPCR